MKSTLEFVLAVRELAGSDNKAGPMVGVSQMTFTRWRNGRDYPSDDHAIRIAELLKMDPEYVVAIVNRDRSRSDQSRALWDRIAAKVAAGVLVAIGAGMASAPSPAVAQSAPASETLCVMSSRRRAWWAAAIPFLPILPGPQDRFA